MQTQLTGERHRKLKIGALARNLEEGVILEADMEVNIAPQIKLLGQTLHVVIKVLEVQQQ